MNKKVEFQYRNEDERIFGELTKTRYLLDTYLKEIKEKEKIINELEFQLKNYEKIVERTIDYVSKFDGEQRDYLLDLLTGDIL